MKWTDLFFTPRCVFCRRILGAGAKERVCPWCHPEQYRLQPPLCRLCGRPALPGAELCRECLHHPPRVTGRSIYAYEGVMREALHRFKYEGCRSYGDYFGQKLWEEEQEFIRGVWPQLLVPVPLHAKRLRQRGYNQAQVAAEALSRRSGIPWGEPLIRSRATAPQMGLGFGLRRQNIAGAFEVRKGAQIPASILLIDDIYTTGSTVEACAEALRRANPEAEIHFLTISAKIYTEST